MRASVAAALAALCLAGCGHLARPQPAVSTGNAAIARRSPAGDLPAGGQGAVAAPRFTAEGPSPVVMRDLPAGAVTAARSVGGRIESPLGDEETARLIADARRLAPPAAAGSGARALAAGRAGPAAPTELAGFDALEFGGLTPADPELAAGPGHLIAVVNAAFAIYDKAGTVLQPATALATLFAGTPGCNLSGIGAFDPNVLYDEEAGRFLIGADGNGRSYCLAASAGPDPLGTWNRYGFATDLGGAFFDFPHAGVGRQAIFVGSNQFLGGFLEGRVFAVDKWAVYAGQPAWVATASTGAASTPQPAHLHGFAQGTWPEAGPHYILTEVFDVGLYSVWSWAEPGEGGTLIKLGDLDLEAATGVPAGLPLPAPQLGSAVRLDANDWRGLDAEYRNGLLWTTQAIACNPGAEVVDCARWAAIDPALPAVVQAGVVAAGGQYRIFPDLAANHCDDVALGYTLTGPSRHPAVWAAGRRGADAPGTMGPDIELKAGEVVYSSFDSPSCPGGPCHRWGDYSGMTPDPDGLRFWYLGKYSKDNGASARWGTWVAGLGFDGCPIVGVAPAPSFAPVEVGAASSPIEVALVNSGNAAAPIGGLGLSDETNFSLDPGGGVDPCYSEMPTLPVGGGCTVTVTFHPVEQAFHDATLTVDAEPAANLRVVPVTGAGFHPCTLSATEVVSNEEPETGNQVVSACQEVVVESYELAAVGSLAVTAGHRIVLDNEVAVAGPFSATLDPFLAMP